MSNFLKLIILLAIVALGAIGGLLILNVGTVAESQLVIEKVFGILAIVGVVGVVSMVLARQ
jgi:hypothetical protein